ncbi:MAG: LuxR C-terminal-related transcriptional regulator [Bacillota bacterium]
MRDSSQLRLGDLRSIFRLVHEVEEISQPNPQSIAWRQHAIVGLSTILRASQAVSHHWRDFTATGKPQIEELTDVGWNNHKARRFWQEQVEQRGFRADPVTDRMSRIHSRVGTFFRRQVISDADWYSSEVVRGIIEICEIEDVLLAVFRHREADQVSGIALNRFRGEGPFSAREHSILRLFNLELYRLYRQHRLRIAGEAKDQSPREPSVSLPPRTQQILQELLRGHSLKQIAQQLGLSRHTVNDHVKVIHRRFGVSTHAELMARCLRNNSPADGASTIHAPAPPQSLGSQPPQ